MPTLGLLLTAVVVAAGMTPSPGLAELASIRTTAPLAEASEQGIEAAVEQVLVSAIRGALAMGLPWVQLRQAIVLPGGMVSVQILASDRNPAEEEPSDTPDDEPAPREARPPAPKVAL